MTDPKFTLNVQSDGRESLTVRTDSEEELEALRAKWGFLIFDGEPKTKQTKDRPEAKKQACPQCGSETVLRQGTSKKTGKPYEFVGCSAYPECKYTDFQKNAA